MCQSHLSDFARGIGAFATPVAERRAEAVDGSYARRIFAWIGRHKGYPGHLARKKREGTALVRLTIDEQGGLESAEVVRSSGYAVLDSLALEQIHEANPYHGPRRGCLRPSVGSSSP
ncbi:energy transducer TonB [Novosphingobium sp. 18050]|uniref:energy transducer TonB n=1 Tax=unclassified Novosphingobium TaxID=2644732 RepID=UPI0034CD3290